MYIYSSLFLIQALVLQKKIRKSVFAFHKAKWLKLKHEISYMYSELTLRSQTKAHRKLWTRLSTEKLFFFHWNIISNRLHNLTLKIQKEKVHVLFNNRTNTDLVKEKYFLCGCKVSKVFCRL